MKFNEFIGNIEKTRGSKLPENELLVMKKLWNACVDCVADEIPVLAAIILRLKQLPKTGGNNDH